MELHVYIGKTVADEPEARQTYLDIRRGLASLEGLHFTGRVESTVELDEPEGEPNGG